MTFWRRRRKYISKTNRKLPTQDQTIVDIVKNEKLVTLDAIVELVHLRHSLPKGEVSKHGLNLQSQGTPSLCRRDSPLPRTLKSYLLSSQARWYWIIMILALAAGIVVTIPGNAYPIVCLRYLIEAIFILWMPGYTFTRTLFPTSKSIPTNLDEADIVERIALSVSISLALVTIVGLLLNYTPWGITLTPTILSLLALTWTFATTAVIRESLKE